MGFKTDKNYYFGRTLDVCQTLGEQVVIVPRRFALEFKAVENLLTHYAIIGTAYVADGHPLFYDGMNEKGLCIAGLNFPENAVYHSQKAGKINLAPFELIPYILGKCATLAEARAVFENLNIADISFSEKMPHTPLHWLIGDKTGEIVVESLAQGLKIYDNPAGVLTNSPPFDMQLFNLKNYARLSFRNPENTFASKLDLAPYSRGMGALGLPGDWSSPSRFIRAAFVKFNYSPQATGSDADDFFHILNTVVVPRGCVEGDNGFQYTLYSCCCDTENLTYIRKTYGGTPFCTILSRYEIDGNQLIIT